jgi:hypothetical protein
MYWIKGWGAEMREWTVGLENCMNVVRRVKQHLKKKA